MATATNEGTGVQDEETPDDELAIRRANASGEPVDEATLAERAAAEGKTIEELAEELAALEGDEAVERIPPAQMSIPGTRDKIPRSTGGRAPEESEIRIMGGRRPIVGSFEKGEHVLLLTDATIRAVEDIDIDDQWGTVSKTIRAHKARQLHVRLATPENLVRALAAAGYDRQGLGVLFDEVVGG